MQIRENSTYLYKKRAYITLKKVQNYLTLLPHPNREGIRREKKKEGYRYRGLRIRSTQETIAFNSMQTKQAKRWQHDWRQQVGERPTQQNAELFHSYVEFAYQMLEELGSADFVYSDLRQVCQPQYLFQVVCDMQGDKLSMRIHQDKDGLKVVVIHKI